MSVSLARVVIKQRASSAYQPIMLCTHALLALIWFSIQNAKNYFAHGGRDNDATTTYLGKGLKLPLALFLLIPLLVTPIVAPCVSGGAVLSIERLKVNQKEEKHSINSHWIDNNRILTSGTDNMPMQGNYYAPPRSNSGNNRNVSLQGVQQPSTNDAIDLIRRMSDLLDTGLNDDALNAVSDLLRAGVSPDAVVAVVTSLHQQSR